MITVEEILDLFRTRGDSQYGGECVTQVEHALQCAALAENEQAAPALIVAALLHDLGHLLHDLSNDAPDNGVDDHHETCAAAFLKHTYPDDVTEPVRLHVAAKRYLCTVEAGYLQQLSQPSVVSLELQGGSMTQQEADDFRQGPFADDAVRLRKWDDEAKVPGLPTPSLPHFSKHLRQVTLKDDE